MFQRNAMLEIHLHIKNMVCNRCIRVVKESLEKIGLEIRDIDLGHAVISGEFVDKNLIRNVLLEAGFELIEDKKHQLVDQVKSIIIDLIQRQSLENMQQSYSEYISARMQKDYHQLSSLFSSYENTTIEKFIILQKIEKVKELLVYDELSLKEIAFLLGYSSTGHISRQFKQITGFTPTGFKALKFHHRKSLDSVI